MENFSIFGDTRETALEILTVSELSNLIKNELEENISFVWVRGEVADLYVSNAGHCYFRLKDGSSQIKAVFFASRNRGVDFSNGMHVLVFGKVSFYEPAGDCEIVVEELESYGKGAIQEAFEQLRKKLEREGLFDESRKRRLPVLIHRVGIVTSLKGAALKDILKILREETKFIEIVIIPTRVQGEAASKEIVDAIRLANEYGQLKIDVLIVGRGGGSTEDLSAYNEEVVVRAIANSSIPVISAVGHERDYTLADMAADLRAPTPTAAAKVIAEREKNLVNEIEKLKEKLTRSMNNIRTEKENHLRQVKLPFSDILLATRNHRGDLGKLLSRLKTAMENIVKKGEETLGRLRGKVSPAVLYDQLQEKREELLFLKEKVSPFILQSKLESKKKEFELLRQHLFDSKDFTEKYFNILEQRKAFLKAVSPDAVLRRGYAIVHNQKGEIVRRAEQVQKGERLEVTLANGRLICIVIEAS